MTTKNNRVVPHERRLTERKIDRRLSRRFGWMRFGEGEGVGRRKGDGWMDWESWEFSSWCDAILSCLTPSAYGKRWKAEGRLDEGELRKVLA
ncbi:uncharacterized protein LAJ45_07501 [Morchella importuna]|uniref:uncharacterized protein n=1 Tax=Morchella importuna TaxID=1174673 RepID=UPI001E8D2BF6|nr:uncharacterized protein LAJ45_07501 [Morchella importuna]KAH8148399.1 hypothetical protein LAJ45_07501 [Morchella importuna]